MHTHEQQNKHSGIPFAKSAACASAIAVGLFIACIVFLTPEEASSQDSMNVDELRSQFEEKYTEPCRRSLEMFVPKEAESIAAAYQKALDTEDSSEQEQFLSLALQKLQEARLEAAIRASEQGSSPNIRHVQAQQSSYRWKNNIGGDSRIAVIDQGSDGTRTMTGDDDSELAPGLPTRVRLDHPASLVLSASGWIEKENPHHAELFFVYQEVISNDGRELVGPPNPLGANYYYTVPGGGRDLHGGRPFTLSTVVHLDAGVYEIGLGLGFQDPDVVPNEHVWSFHKCRFDGLIIEGVPGAVQLNDPE